MAEPGEEIRCICPHCGVELAVDLSLANRVICPGCNGEFELESCDDRSDEIDGQRIRQISALRRAELRTQSYFVIAAIGCAAGVAQCVFKAYEANQWNLTRWILLAVGIFLACGAIGLARMATKIPCSSAFREPGRPLPGPGSETPGAAHPMPCEDKTLD